MRVEVMASPLGRADAVVAFSGHNIVAVPLHPAVVISHLPDDDPGAPVSALFLSWLGATLGVVPGTLDLVMVGEGTGEPATELVPVAVDEHPRVVRAVTHRSDITVHTDAEGDGVVILGRGLAGRLEVSVEVAADRRSRGVGTSLARAALGLARNGELVWAQVSPGNVASVRTFLRAGYRPVCSEVLFLRRASITPAEAGP